VIQDIEALRATIRQERVRQGLTQVDLAKRAGVSQGSLSGIETGSMDPSVKTLLLILGALGLGFGIYLMLGGGKKEGTSGS
jgi:transcriptional regulator with XRE-family HTH domain